MLSSNEPQQFFCDIPANANGILEEHMLSYYQWGNVMADKTVICVHGLTRNGRDFDNLAKQLGEHYNVICPDMPGRGKSSHLPNAADYSNPNYVTDIVHLLTTLGITNVIWVGTSMGGIMAMLAANTHPGLIEALVLNDIGCMIPASGLARIRDIANFKTQFATKEEAETTFRKRCESFGISVEAHWRHLLKHGIEEKDGAFCFTYDPAIFTAGFSKDAPLVDISLWPLWPAITKIPTLLIRGKTSDILPEDVAKQMQANHPHLQFLEFEEAGHAPALMADKQIAPILEWMSAIGNSLAD